MVSRHEASSLGAHGEVLAHRITTRCIDDRASINKMVDGFCGTLIGDKGYISDELEFELAEKGVKLITKTRENMSFKRVLSDEEKSARKKRRFIETINDQLKNILHIAHIDPPPPITASLAFIEQPIRT